MRRNLLFLFATTSMFGATPAFAQEVPTATVSDWTGFYIGALGGGAWGNIDGESSGASTTTTTSPTTGQPDDGEIDYGDFNVDDESWLAGLQIGFDWQSGDFVFGVIGDLMWAEIEGSEGFEFDISEGEVITGSGVGEAGAELDRLTTIRAKAGYANGPFLVYLTGGLAWADVEAAVGFDYEFADARVAGIDAGDWEYYDDDSDGVFG